MAGESAQRLLVDRVCAHRILDTAAVDIAQVDADGRAAAVAASARDERGDEPADALLAFRR